MKKVRVIKNLEIFQKYYYHTIYIKLKTVICWLMNSYDDDNSSDREHEAKFNNVQSVK